MDALGRMAQRLAATRARRKRFQGLRRSINEVRERISKLEEAQHRPAYSNGNGANHGDMEEIIANSISAPRAEHVDRAGGRRRPDGYLRGQPFWNAGDDIAWEEPR